MPVIIKPFIEKLGGSTTASTYVGKVGEMFYDLVDTRMRVSNGVTPGGSIISGTESTTAVDEDFIISTSGNVLTSPPSVGEFDFIFGSDGVLGVPHTISSDNLLFLTAPSIELETSGENATIEIGYQAGAPTIYIGVSGQGKTTHIWSDRFAIYADAPSTSKGVSGDSVGMVAINASYLFYCTGDHNGVADIWKRVALTGGTW